ncbi:mechanosensitive ion channel domain-containing protein [uncultured Pseudodesulfovibrio sp.]|uniref:mechanosensitive ion channel family protein n=1 Tax=uncultured Pseudodesulfovibrio sp. TaxID=2035858 RepID=UPI0029C7FAA3|nr:mechanosensitive ion channel domain-containing protein [uncultured Pseudodesulfovibrio sp.]
MERAHRNDKQSLYDTWIQYLLVGKTPVFTSGFWDKPLPDNRWFNLKKTEIIAGLTTLTANALKFVVLFLTLAAIGTAAKRLVQLVPDKKTDDFTRNKVSLYFTIVVVGLSLYLTANIVFPAGNDSLSALAASLFLFGTLKLSKYICNDSFLSNSGHTRISFLFLISTQLLVHHLPSRSVTLIFILIVLALWGSDTLRAWRNKGLHLKKTAMRGGSLAPLFIISFFGYGRLTCMLTIIWCLGIFIRAFGSVWSQSLFVETDKSSKLQKGLAKSLLVPLGWAIAFGISYLWLVDFLGENTLSTIVQLKASIGTYSLYLNDVIILVVLFFLTYNCIAAFKVSIDHVGSKWQKAKRGAVPSIQTLVTYATWSFFTLLALRILGVSLTSITVIAGGLSVGIGFGLQNVVNNFISGLILLFGRSIQQGDVIEVGGMWCTVKKINIRTTLVETFESAVIMIPNSDLVTTQVTNWTKNNPTLRRDILVGVAYGSDTKKVAKTLLVVAETHPHVLKKPEPFILFNDFGASSLDFILRVWVDDIDHTIRTTSELRFAIDDAFREAGIEIAFPQMDVHFKTAPAFAGHMKFMGDKN